MTDDHFKVASEMTNFSGWVREQLSKYIQDQQESAQGQTTYVCKHCANSFRTGPITTRMKGRHFAVERVCPECESFAIRWDIA
jgi:hypothetical protein